MLLRRLNCKTSLFGIAIMSLKPFGMQCQNLLYPGSLFEESGFLKYYPSRHCCRRTFDTAHILGRCIAGILADEVMYVNYSPMCLADT